MSPITHRHALALALTAGGFISSCIMAGGGPVTTTNVDAASPKTSDDTLAKVGDFAVISDQAKRSQALFIEAGKVLQHPRCLNCHPNDDRPRQRDLETHVPAVLRGDDDHGIVGLRCDSCHQMQNVQGTRVPGAPKWGLAPLSMAWQGKSLGEICEQLKDKQRNGGKTLDEIVDHTAHDALVAWGWTPGADREPAPGTQQAFGELFAAWVETGAHCPPHDPTTAVFPADAIIKTSNATTTSKATGAQR